MWKVSLVGCACTSHPCRRSPMCKHITCKYGDLSLFFHLLAFVHTTTCCPPRRHLLFSMGETAEDAAAVDPSQPTKKTASNLHYASYGSEKESPFLPAIKQLISKDLSEPYSIYVYRYFLYQWGELCFMVSYPSVQYLRNLTLHQALDEQDNMIGVIVCKLEPHRGGPMRGYIAMLATREEYRGQGIAGKLVRLAIDKMIEKDADEVRSTVSFSSTQLNTNMDRRSLWKPK